MSRPKSKAEQIERYKSIYQGFEVKDLSQEEFVRQMLDIMDPKKVMDDLGDIQLQRARERTNKIRIDRGLARARR